MPQHPEHPSSGITDATADKAHDFIEGAEEQEHKAHPEAQLNRGTHHEAAHQAAGKGLGATDKGDGQPKSKIDLIKEALHLKKDDN